MLWFCLQAHGFNVENRKRKKRVIFLYKGSLDSVQFSQIIGRIFILELYDEPIGLFAFSFKATEDSSLSFAL